MKKYLLLSLLAVSIFTTSSLFAAEKNKNNTKSKQEKSKSHKEATKSEQEATTIIRREDDPQAKVSSQEATTIIKREDTASK